jgi:hypothetical protein
MCLKKSVTKRKVIKQTKVIPYIHNDGRKRRHGFGDEEVSYRFAQGIGPDTHICAAWRELRKDSGLAYTSV